MVARLPEHENIMLPRICQMARGPGGDRAGIGGDDRVIRQAACSVHAPPPAASSDLSARVPRSSISSFHAFMPALRLLEEAAVFARRKLRQERVAARRGVADQRTFDRIAQTDALRIDGRSARHAPARLRDRTRYRGTSCRRSAACRNPPAPPATAACREVRCRRWRKGCRRRSRPCLEAA